jgi:hypothetical protein
VGRWLSGLGPAAALLAGSCQPAQPLLEASGAGITFADISPTCECGVVQINDPIVLGYRPVGFDYELRKVFIDLSNPETFLFDETLRGTVSVEDAGNNLIVEDRYKSITLYGDGTTEEGESTVHRLLITPTGNVLDAAVIESGRATPLDEASVNGMRQYYADYYPTYNPRGYRTGDTFPTDFIDPLEATAEAGGFTRSGRAVVLGVGFDGEGLVVSNRATFSSTAGAGGTEGYFVIDIDTGVIVRSDLLTLEVTTEEPDVTYATFETYVLR